jgi:hypothetical protein
MIISTWAHVVPIIRFRWVLLVIYIYMKNIKGFNSYWHSMHELQNMKSAEEFRCLQSPLQFRMFKPCTFRAQICRESLIRKRVVKRCSYGHLNSIISCHVMVMWCPHSLHPCIWHVIIMWSMHDHHHHHHHHIVHDIISVIILKIFLQGMCLC